MRFAQFLNESLSFQNRIHLFRGIGKPNNLDRIGKWWSTNPYYAMVYGANMVGQIFVATIDKEQLQQGLADRSIADASQDEFPNYIFRSTDPPNARPMTMPEITKLKGLASGPAKPIGPAGGAPPPISQKIAAVPTPSSQQNAQATGKMPAPGGGIFQQLHGQDAINAAYAVFGR
jgi:hypothetical protein